MNMCPLTSSKLEEILSVQFAKWNQASLFNHHVVKKKALVFVSGAQAV